jgi:tetratricopeptide (TPR) repeat protein
VKAVIFEEHSSVLPFWWEQGVRARTVVYLDAHLDLQHISAERLAALEVCGNVERVRALEKRHALLPDKGYSYSLEDFLYPAAKMGLISRLIWVAPSHVRTVYVERAIQQFQQMDGVRPEDLYSFRKTIGGWIEGRILGLDIIVCDFLDLDQIAVPSDAVIDIDIDYFVTVPGDNVWVSPQAVFDVLRRLPLVSDTVTISRSVSSGFMPLRYRFFADYLAALWENQQEQQEHFARLFDYDKTLLAGERDAAVASCGQELKRYPHCAATWYLLGLAESDLAVGERCRLRAAELSGAYRHDVLRRACAIRNRMQTIDLSGFLILQQRLTAEMGSEPTDSGLAWVAFGLIYCKFGDIPRSMDCYRKALSTIGVHPELALEIGKLLAASRCTEEAAVYLRAALMDDKSRTGAHLALAQLEGRNGLLEEARQHLERAWRAAPAWPQLLDLLAQVHARLGNQPQATGYRRRLDEQRTMAQQLLERLS